MATGRQLTAGCQLDCKYTCHKKCYSLVVTKCISRAYEEMVRGAHNSTSSQLAND